MNEVPDSFEALPESTVSELMDTIQGICNESTLDRFAVLAALEAVKLTLFIAWERERAEP